MADTKPELTQTNAISEDDYSIFTPGQKLAIVLVVSVAAFISPASAYIYLPAMGQIGKELGVSSTAMNWSITTYIICQGIAPSLMSSVTETLGRRPVYLLCLVIYIGANVGLALQSNFVALLILRAVQSSGSSSMVLLGTAVIVDVSTTAERGKYYSIGTSATVLGPAFAPALGGILAEYLGWPSIFVFMATFAGLVLGSMLLFYPETSRHIVGNGSRPPQIWNLTLRQWCRQRSKIFKNESTLQADDRTSLKPAKKHGFSNPLKSLVLLFDKQTGLPLFYTGLAYAAFNFVISSLQDLVSDIYQLNTLQVGLCYMPLGLGGAMSAVMLSRLVDWNYRRLAREHSYPISRTRQQPIGSFPIEKARLQITLPMAWLAGMAVAGLGWSLQTKLHLAVPLVLLGFIGFCNTGTINVMSTLIMDLYPKEKATSSTASASINLIKCGMGAAASAFVLPLTNAIGIGWGFTLMASVWALSSGLLFISIRLGPHGRMKGRTH
ncbi:hypothetical protein WAI453_009579 [Rhynchosporium graminicola]|uniref:Related to MFS multidrug transporter n=1 Tax=Rhynchosporium graminicola TaxID=2792576 RepID=A0A1E1KT65_9HELO|nr:related to MFS multidrug transporter [Rhynchosporium commune]